MKIPHAANFQIHTSSPDFSPKTQTCRFKSFLDRSIGATQGHLKLNMLQIQLQIFSPNLILLLTFPSREWPHHLPSFVI